MDPKANTPKKQQESTTDPQDNEIKGNFIGDLIGQPKPAAQEADQQDEEQADRQRGNEQEG